VTAVFFDRTCGKKLPQAFWLLNVDVKAHHKYFEHDEDDDVWLAAVGRQGWIVVTNDKRIRFNASELQAIIDHKVGCVVFTKGTLSRWDMMRLLVRAWDDIQRLASEEPRPFIYSLTARGTLTRLYPKP
jgi:PIN like domain